MTGRADMASGQPYTQNSDASAEFVVMVATLSFCNCNGMLNVQHYIICHKKRGSETLLVFQIPRLVS